jgi:hypothetical protein
MGAQPAHLLVSMTLAPSALGKRCSGARSTSACGAPVLTFIRPLLGPWTTAVQDRTSMIADVVQCDGAGHAQAINAPGGGTRWRILGTRVA